METVVLVDEQGVPIGTQEKVAAHRNGGRLHLAFSILILDRSGRMLLQQRSRRKYHFAGLWSNSCCGHPRPGEPVDVAAARRLEEELGFTVPLEALGTLLYAASDPTSGLAEREFLHVFRGRHEGPVAPHPDEVEALRWLAPHEVRAAIERAPHEFTPWFPLVLGRLSPT